jgi:hypothetical protein
VTRTPNRHARSSRSKTSRSRQTERRIQNQSSVSHARRRTTPIEASGFQAPNVDSVPPVSRTSAPTMISGDERRDSAGASELVRPVSMRTAMTPAAARKTKSASG